MSRRRRPLLLVLALSVLAPLAGAGASAPAVAARSVPPATPGASDGIGDRLYPDLGSAGLDVVSYDWRATYDPGRGRIEATSTISTSLLHHVDEISLDALGLDVAAVLVDGERARFHTTDEKLIVELPRPAGPRLPWNPLVVAVTYTAEGIDPDGSGMFDVGWFATADGTSYTLNEPDGARQWMPVNDHPSDKATWRFEITVPAGTTAVANGTLVGDEPVSDPELGRAHRWTWAMDDPMSTYLLGVQTGPYELIEGEGPHGLPLLSAVLRDDVEAMQPHVDQIAEQIAFFEQYFGKYPLSGYGLAITDSAPGLAMETQGRSTFSRDDLARPGHGLDQLFLSHELAHQWFGNAVSPATWSDIWLNESLASYAQWMWTDHEGIFPLDAQAQTSLRMRQAPTFPTAEPEVGTLFSYEVYDGGATALHALRQLIGDEAFFGTLRRWVAANRGTSRSTADFIAVAEEVSGRQLDTFFKKWVGGVLQPPYYPG